MLVGQVQYPMAVLTIELRRVMASALLRPGYRPFLLGMAAGRALVGRGWLKRDNAQRWNEHSGMAWYDLTEAGEAEVATWRINDLDGRKP